MKLVNLITGATLSVEDEDGGELLAAGGWAKSGTAAGKKALSDGESKAARVRGENPPDAARLAVELEQLEQRVAALETAGAPADPSVQVDPPAPETPPAPPADPAKGK